MKRVLAIGLDAAEPSLVERWMEQGSLPNLRKLYERGAYGRLASSADWLAGSIWVTFYTGRNPASHGFYNYLSWRPDRMSTETPRPEWFPLQPFWRDFGPGDPRAVVVDIPHTESPQPFNGVEILGWSNHDSIVSFTTYPHEMGRRLLSRFGGPFVTEEQYGPMSKTGFIALRDQLIELTGRIQDMCVALMKEERWDLFLLCVPTLHRAGHRLWSLVDVRDRLSAAEREELSDALRQEYMAVDRVVGKLVEAAGPETHVLIFSLHGLGVNNSRVEALPEMLERVLAGSYSRPVSSRKLGLLKLLREAVPVAWRHRAKSRLPIALRHKLTAFWRTGAYRWSETPAFSMMADVQGWIRINLKGREAQGLIEPGLEYDALCEAIAAGLKTFVDADTGRPVVKEIVRADRVFKGRKLDWLPDLIVTWDDEPASKHRALASPKFGTVPWPTPGRDPDGRSGTHHAQGVLIAAGPGVKSGNIENGHILDLAPTILALLGRPVPDEMEGKVIPLEG